MGVYDLKENPIENSGSTLVQQTQHFDSTESNTVCGEKFWIKKWWKELTRDEGFRNNLWLFSSYFSLYMCIRAKYVKEKSI